MEAEKALEPLGHQRNSHRQLIGPLLGHEIRDPLESKHRAATSLKAFVHQLITQLISNKKKKHIKFISTISGS